MVFKDLYGSVPSSHLGLYSGNAHCSVVRMLCKILTLLLLTPVPPPEISFSNPSLLEISSECLLLNKELLPLVIVGDLHHAQCVHVSPACQAVSLLGAGTMPAHPQKYPRCMMCMFSEFLKFSSSRQVEVAHKQILSQAAASEDRAHSPGACHVQHSYLCCAIIPATCPLCVGNT